jgi:hypothetical protein
MAILKPKTESTKSPQPDNGRRSFMWKAGAAMSAVVASAVAGFPKSGVDKTDIQKDANAVRTLHRSYEARLHEGRYEEVLDLFEGNAEVVYNGGLFKGEKSLSRLYCDLFRSGQTGKKIEPAPGSEIDPVEFVEVAGDRKSAVGRFPYSIQVGKPMDEESTLVAMARLQGEGIVKWWEGGICEASYVKAGKNWKIKRLQYRPSVKADYKPGRAYARPIEVPAFAKVYPADPSGPDRLV